MLVAQKINGVSVAQDGWHELHKWRSMSHAQTYLGIILSRKKYRGIETSFDVSE